MRQVKYLECIHCNKQVDVVFGYTGIAVYRCKCSRPKFFHWLLSVLRRK